MRETELLEEMLSRVPVPPADVRDDVARGRAALRRRRLVSASAIATAVAAVVLTASVVGGSPRATVVPGIATSPDVTPAPSATPPPSRTPRTPARREADGVPDLSSDRSVLVGFRDVIAEHLDGADRWLRYAENQQGNGTAIGTKLDWRDGGMLEVVVGTRWDDLGSFYDLDSAGMRPVTYRGLPARVGGIGGDQVVSVRHRDGTVVSLVASSSFGNNGTSTATLGIRRSDLLEAAADPRLRLERARS